MVDDLSKFPGAVWFTGARLNFAENLLRYRDDQDAFIFKGETRKPVRMTYAELYDAVARLVNTRTQVNTRGRFLKGSIGSFALKKAQISGVSR